MINERLVYYASEVIKENNLVIHERVQYLLEYAAHLQKDTGKARSSIQDLAKRLCKEEFSLVIREYPLNRVSSSESFVSLMEKAYLFLVNLNFTYSSTVDDLTRLAQMEN
ncbi:MAG TPA: hypothetical protein VHQ24_03610 [Lachnospiraceae bacterium]|nr:hypothetical protein [Lachnospiraceae bacterium]